MLAAVMTAFLFAASAAAAGQSTRFLGAKEANFLRCLVALTLLASYAHTLGGGWGGPGLGWFLLSGLVGFGLGDWALFEAYPRLGSALTILIVQCGAVIVAVVVEWAWLGVATSHGELLWGVVVLGGLGLALGSGHPTSTIARPEHRMAGVAFAVLASVGQGLGAVVSRKAILVSQAEGVSVDGITAAYQRLSCGIVFAALLYLWERREWGPRLLLVERNARRAWPFVVANGIAGPCLGVSCFQWALATEKSAIVMPIVAVSPLLVMPLARWAEDDRFSWPKIAGALLAVGGVVGLLTGR